MGTGMEDQLYWRPCTGGQGVDSELEVGQGY